MAKTNATFTKHARDAQKHGETLRVYLEKLAAQREKFKTDIANAVHQADIAVATFKAHGADKHLGLKLKQDMEAKLKALEDVKSEYQDWAQDAAQALTAIPAHQAKLVEEIEALSTEASAPRWKQAVAKAAALDKPQAQPAEALHIAPREDAVPLHTQLVKETRNAPTIRQPAAPKPQGVKASLKHAVEIMMAPGAAKANQLAAEAETAIAEAVQAINVSYKRVASPLDDALAEQKHLSAAFKAMNEAKQAEAATQAPLGEAVVALTAKARKAYDDFMVGYRASKAQPQANPVAQGPVPTAAERLHAAKESVAAFYAATQKRIIETAEKMKQKREERAAAREAATHTQQGRAEASPANAQTATSPLPGTNIQVVAFINSQREGILATLIEVLNTECADIVAHDRNVDNLARHILNKAVTHLKATELTSGNIEQLAEQAIVEAHKATLAELRTDMAHEAAKAQNTKAGEAAFALLQCDDIRSRFKLELAAEFQKELGAAFAAKVTDEDLKRLVEYALAKAENALDERDFGDIEAAKLAAFAVDSGFKTVLAELRNPKQNHDNGTFQPNAGAVLNNQNIARESRPNSLRNRLEDIKLIDAETDYDDLEISPFSSTAIAERFAPHGAQRAVREASQQKPTGSGFSIEPDQQTSQAHASTNAVLAKAKQLTMSIRPWQAKTAAVLAGIGLWHEKMGGHYFTTIAWDMATTSASEGNRPATSTKMASTTTLNTSEFVRNENKALQAEAEARKIAARFDAPDMSRYKNISAADYEKLSDREKAMLGEGDLALQEAREGTASQQASAQPEEKSLSKRISFEDEKQAGSHQKAKSIYSETYTTTVPMEGLKNPLGSSFNSGFNSSFNWKSDKDDKGPGKG